MFFFVETPGSQDVSNPRIRSHFASLPSVGAAAKHISLLLFIGH
jgi:hypothetical protein